jgi:hypothetical protein
MNAFDVVTFLVVGVLAAVAGIYAGAWIALQIVLAMGGTPVYG